MFGMIPFSGAPYSGRLEPPAGDAPKATEAAGTETSAAAAANVPTDAQPETTHKEKI